MKKKLLIGLSICFIGLVAGWTFKLCTPSDEKIRSALPPHSFYLFTLTESDACIPCLQAEIEGISFLAKLDMGYEGVLSLPKHLLEQLAHKYDERTVLFTGIRGKKYEASLFTIPQCYIEDVELVNLPVKESHLEFERDTKLRTNKSLEPSDLVARIGWWTFSGTVVLIDLQNSVAICCDSLETLQANGYSLEQFIATDLLPTTHILEFDADIGNRVVKCMLDTGCTFNLIHNPSSVSSAENEKSEYANVDFDQPLPPTMLSIGGHCLGSCTFYETQLPLGIEAIIGIDFLETQIVCIDFINRKLFLCPAPEDNPLDSEIVPAAAEGSRGLCQSCAIPGLNPHF